MSEKVHITNLCNIIKVFTFMPLLFPHWLFPPVFSLSLRRKLSFAVPKPFMVFRITDHLTLLKNWMFPLKFFERL